MVLTAMHIAMEVVVVANEEHTEVAGMGKGIEVGSHNVYRVFYFNKHLHQMNPYAFWASYYKNLPYFVIHRVPT